MLSPKQITILGKFLPNPFAEKSFKDFKEKSNLVTQLALREFDKEELVTKRTVNNSHTYTLIISDRSVAYLTLIAQEKISETAKITLALVLEHTPSSACIMIFGSHAKGNARKESDLDVLIITDKKEETKRAIADVTSRAPLEIDAHIFTEAEVKEMLTNDEHNLAKEVVAGNLPTRNAMLFYSLVRSARYAPPRSR